MPSSCVTSSRKREASSNDATPRGVRPKRILPPGVRHPACTPSISTARPAQCRPRARPRPVSCSRTSSAIIRPDTSRNVESWDRRGRVLRASISFVVIGFAASINAAAAQYLPPQSPPAGYPPPGYYPYPPPAYFGYRGYPPPAYYRANPSARFQGTDQDADGEAFDEEYDRPYPPQPRFGDTPGGVRSERLAHPTVSSQDHGTAVAALPPDYQPEHGPTKEIPPQFRRTVVDYPTVEPSSTIIIDTPNRYLYLTRGNGKAIRYGVGVGREGFTWSGTERISRMKEWPDWFPPKVMITRQPYLPRFMAGGETNPLGARAMYLGNTEYRIHGTNQPSTIGSFVSSGCIRLTNEDIEDLYRRVTVGTRVIVLPQANTATSQLRPRHKPTAMRWPEETGPSRGVRGSDSEGRNDRQLLRSDVPDLPL
jgi:lipoprotein-anchoring transpeptidase ErfK/SrfK